MDSDNTPTCVMVWAESVQDEDGDEVRDWYVALGNDDGEPVDEGNISWFYGNEKAAKEFARSLGKSNKLPVEYFD